jgi:hypothetical protein
MKVSLALAVDNTRPSAPLRGYRDSLTSGKCQRCRAPGVRTVGVRRFEEPRFKRLALCPGCIELAHVQGFAVLS